MLSLVVGLWSFIFGVLPFRLCLSYLGHNFKVKQKVGGGEEGGRGRGTIEEYCKQGQRKQVITLCSRDPLSPLRLSSIKNGLGRPHTTKCAQRHCVKRALFQSRFFCSRQCTVSLSLPPYLIVLACIVNQFITPPLTILCSISVPFGLWCATWCRIL